MHKKKKSKLTHREQLAGTREASPHASPSAEGRTGCFNPFATIDARAVLAIGLLVAVSYVPAFSGGFIWDDVLFTEEPVIHKPSGLLNIWFSPADIKKEGHYWPLTYTSFWLEHKLWGLTPAGYHVVNVLLHVVNCLLVWHLLLHLAVPGAWFIAAVFAVHPLHVESVAWVMERKDLLSTLFYLTAVLAWIRFVEAPDWRRYALVLALFVAGMLSKSVVVTLPAALLILAWWQRDRVTATDLARVLPLFAVGFAIALADLAFYRGREAVSFDFSLLERGLLAARLLWFYAGKLVWPTDLAVIYALPAPNAADPVAWGYAVAALALTALLWVGRHRLGRGPLAGALFFAVTLSPVLGFVDFGYMQFSFAADRFQYLAGIGVIAVVAGAGAHVTGRCPPGTRKGMQVLALAVLVLFGTLTWRQAGVYRDDVTLFSHVVSLNPQARNAHLNLGDALYKAGRPEEALAATRIAVEKFPDSAKAQANLAEILRKQERHEEAVEAYHAALRIDSTYALNHAGLGGSLFHVHRYEEAVSALEHALALQSDTPDAWARHIILGQALQKLHRLEAAANHYERAMVIDPHNAGAMVLLAPLRFGQKRYEEARGLYQKLVGVNPDSAQTHANLGVALYYLERYDEALRSFDRALALDPDLEAARTGREQARARRRETDERAARGG